MVFWSQQWYPEKMKAREKPMPPPCSLSGPDPRGLWYQGYYIHYLILFDCFNQGTFRIDVMTTSAMSYNGFYRVSSLFNYDFPFCGSKIMLIQ